MVLQEPNNSTYVQCDTLRKCFETKHIHSFNINIKNFIASFKRKGEEEEGKRKGEEREEEGIGQRENRRGNEVMGKKG